MRENFYSSPSPITAYYSYQSRDKTGERWGGGEGRGVAVNTGRVSGN